MQMSLARDCPGAKGLARSSPSQTHSVLHQPQLKLHVSSEAGSSSQDSLFLQQRRLPPDCALTSR